ncbi:MAG: hypothetical protein KDD89_05955 [Anaerolineales bacterium]|nr:hypothetical protein [Anaerolineales bacterium]
MNTIATERQDKQKQWLYWALFLALFGLVNFFSSGRWVFAPAAWLGTVLTLRYLHGQTGWRPWVPFYLVLWLSTAVAWVDATPMPGVAHWVFMGINTLIALVPFALERWLVRRLDRAYAGDLPFAATLILPALLVGQEFLTTSSNPIGNFGAAGYSQFGFAPFVQLTAVTGLLGLTFVMAWFASVVNWVWTYHRFNWGRVWRGVAVYTAVFLLVLAYGTARLLTAPAPASATSDNTVAVASFTLHSLNPEEMFPLYESDLAAFRTETQTRHADYLAETAVVAANGAKIVLWPEGAGLGVEEDVNQLLAQGQALADQYDIYLAMPVFTLFADSERPAENVLYIADPAGEIVLTHVKYGGNALEGTLAGNGELQAIETPYGTLSGVICWDTDFPATVRQAGEMGVDILLSPARDWAGIDPMHGQMATFRAVENGMAVIRQADGGWSVTADAYGRVLNESPVDVAYQTSAISTQGVPTLYAQFGDWLGWFSLALFALLGGWALVAGLQHGRVAKTVGTLVRQ